MCWPSLSIPFSNNTKNGSWSRLVVQYVGKMTFKYESGKLTKIFE